MNLFKIIDEIEKIDPEIHDRLSPRRAAIKNITSFGGKVAVAALPFALGTLFKRAYGATASSSVIDVLNFALTLEHLEAAFYAQAMTSGIVKDQAYIGAIKTDEDLHVQFLTAAITQAGGTPVAAAKYDFTAPGGIFSFVFKDYMFLLAAAEIFEDTGVRAYKGQAPNLISNPTVLAAAMGIHSVEARHAAAVRYLRRENGILNKPWIASPLVVGNDTGIPQADGNYANENTSTEGGVDLSSPPEPFMNVGAVFEAFDEPLDSAAVLSLVTPFIVS